MMMGIRMMMMNGQMMMMEATGAKDAAQAARGSACAPEALLDEMLCFYLSRHGKMAASAMRTSMEKPDVQNTHE